MSNLTNDIFLENVYDKYWDKYLVECKTTKTHANAGDFLVWLDEKDLIPEYQDEWYR